MDKSEKVEELRQRLDELRDEAADEGLAIVASWQDKKGNMQSVQLTLDDILYVTVKQ